MKKSLLVLAIVLLVAFGAMAQTVSGSYSYALGMEFVPTDDNGTPADTSDDVAAHLSASEDGEASASLSFTSEDGAASVSWALANDIEGEDASTTLSGATGHTTVSVDPLALFGVEAPVTVGMVFDSLNAESLTVTMPDVVKIGFSYSLSDILNGTENSAMGVSADVLAVPGLTLGVTYDMNVATDFVSTDDADTEDYEITVTSDYSDDFTDSIEVEDLTLTAAEQTALEALIEGFGDVSYEVAILEDNDDVTTTGYSSGMGASIGVDLVALAGLPLDTAKVGFNLALANLGEETEGSDDVATATTWDTSVDVAMAGATVGVTYDSDSIMTASVSYAGVPNLSNSVSFTTDGNVLGLSLGYTISDALSASLALADVLGDYMGLTTGVTYVAGGLTFGVELAGLTETAASTEYTYASGVITKVDTDASADNFSLTISMSGSF